MLWGVGADRTPPDDRHQSCCHRRSTASQGGYHTRLRTLSTAVLFLGNSSWKGQFRSRPPWVRRHCLPRRAYHLRRSGNRCNLRATTDRTPPTLATIVVNSSPAPFPLFTGRHLSASASTTVEIAVTDTTVNIAVTDSTDWRPRRIRLGADHRHRRWKPSIFGPNSTRPRSSLPQPTTLTRSSSLWVSFPTSGLPWNSADRRDPLELLVVAGKLLSGSIPASSDLCLSRRHRLRAHHFWLHRSRPSPPSVALPLQGSSPAPRRRSDVIELDPGMGHGLTLLADYLL